MQEPVQYATVTSRSKIGSVCFTTGLMLPLLVVSNIKLNINTHLTFNFVVSPRIELGFKV